MTEQEIAFGYEMAEMALRGKHFAEAEDKYKEIASKTNSPESWCGMAVSKFGQLMTTHAVDDVFYCFQKAKSLDESKVSEIETVAIETSMEVIKSLYDLIILTGKAMDQAQVRMAQAALASVVGAISTYRSNKQGSVMGTIVSASFTAFSFNEYVNASTSIEDMRALNQTAASLMVIIKTNVQKLVTKELALADKFLTVLNKSYEEVTVTIPNRKKAQEIKAAAGRFRAAGWLSYGMAVIFLIAGIIILSEGHGRETPAIFMMTVFAFGIGKSFMDTAKKREVDAGNLELSSISGNKRDFRSTDSRSYANITKTAGEEIICAPMAGRFHRNPRPGEAPFVKVRDCIKPGSMLCVIEHEDIKYEVVEQDYSGTVVEVLVSNLAIVEKDQPLFRIKL